MAETKRGLAGDSALALDDLGDAVWGHGNLPRQLSRRNFQLIQFIGENLAGMDCGAGHRFFFLNLMIIHDLDVGARAPLPTPPSARCYFSAAIFWSCFLTISVAVCNQFISGTLLAIGPIDVALAKAIVSNVATIIFEAAFEAASMVLEMVF